MFNIYLPLVKHHCQMAACLAYRVPHQTSLKTIILSVNWFFVGDSVQTMVRVAKGSNRVWWLINKLRKLRWKHFHVSNSNVLFLTSESAISGIMYSLLWGRHNIFLTLFITKFVVKCATKFWKSVDKHRSYVQKHFWIGNFLSPTTVAAILEQWPIKFI